MEIQTIQTLISGVSGLGFLVGIIILYKTGVLKFLLNGKSADTDDKMDKILKNQQELQFHYNDETTQELKNLNIGISKMLVKLDEFEKYGIPCRNREKI